jgi:hypothetical protein
MQGTENPLEIPNLQTPATPSNPRPHTRNETLGQQFESARWLYVSCFSGRLCEEAASPLRKMPQLARIAREKMQAAHLSLWLRPDTYSSEEKRRAGVTSGRVRPADVRVLLLVAPRVTKAMSTVAQQ